MKDEFRTGLADWALIQHSSFCLHSSGVASGECATGNGELGTRNWHLATGNWQGVLHRIFILHPLNDHSPGYDGLGDSAD
jgi:hypothetical protein